MNRSLAIVVAGVVIVAALSSASLAASATRLPGFRSPSKNIRCLYVPGGPGMMLCSIGRADYASELQARCIRPDGSGVDWHGFTLTTTGKGRVNCSGGIQYNPGTQRPRYVTLPYGKTWRHGVFTCTSRTAGVTCRNRSGHGLFISRQSYRVW
jgi:hypothetical protein